MCYILNIQHNYKTDISIQTKTQVKKSQKCKKRKDAKEILKNAKTRS